jgi:hypothetical protein
MKRKWFSQLQYSMMGILHARKAVRFGTSLLMALTLCFSVLPSLTFADDLRGLNDEFRQILAHKLREQFPAAPGVIMDTQNAAFATTRVTTGNSFFDVFVAWDVRQDFWMFGEQEVAQGMIIGSVYLPEGFSPRGEPIAEGPYLVRMLRSATGSWQMQLMDVNTGRRVARASSITVNPVTRIQIPGTRLDIKIRVTPHPTNPFGFCVELWLSYLCPNGLWLDKALIWKRCIP